MIWPCSGLFGLYDFENGKRCRHMNFYFQLILKSPKKYENLDFSISGLCLAFKKYFGLFSIFLAFRCLEYPKSFKFESFWSNFAIKKNFAENFANRISVPSSSNVKTKTNSDECEMLIIYFMRSSERIKRRAGLSCVHVLILVAIRIQRLFIYGCVNN